MKLIRFREPFRAFRFIVKVNGMNERVVAVFTQFSGIKMKVELCEFRTGGDLRGVMDGFPVFTSYENVTLTNGVIGDNVFMEWIAASAAGSNTGGTGKKLSRDIIITAVDELGKPGITWHLEGALPVGYTLSSFDSMESALITESVEFCICGFTRKTHEPTGYQNIH